MPRRNLAHDSSLYETVGAQKVISHETQHKQPAGRISILLGTLWWSHMVRLGVQVAGDGPKKQRKDVRLLQFCFEDILFQWFFHCLPDNSLLMGLLHRFYYVW